MLIATMLSAQTRDPVTAPLRRACSESPARRARWPSFTTKQIEQLIYPVSFYRNKAVHVKATCEQILTRFGGKVPATMEELLTLPGVGPQDRQPGLDPRAPEPRATSASTRTCTGFEPARLGGDTHAGRDRARALHGRAEAVVAVVNLYLVTWGQNVCRPVYPLCSSCAIADLCPRDRCRQSRATTAMNR